MISGEFYALAAAICWSVAAVFYKKGVEAGAILLHEKIRFEAVIVTLLIIIGIWILCRGHYIKGEKNIKLGVSLALLAAFLYAFSIVATKTGLKDVDPFQNGKRLNIMMIII